MDEIVAKIGTRNNCTFCGVFRRQALDRAAQKLGACKLATGHNADDMGWVFCLKTGLITKISGNSNDERTSGRCRTFAKNCG